MQRIFFIISCAVLSTIGYGQETIDVFTINKSDKTTLNIEQDLAAFSILKIEHFSNAYASFKRNKATSFQLKLPISKSETITLKLTPQNIYAADFKLIEKSEKGDKIIPFTKPLHFTGTVQGEANSLVGFTITADQLMGVLAYKGSNYNLELQEQYKNTL